LADYSVRGGAVLDLITPLSTMMIYAKTLDGKKIPLEVSGGDSIRSDKQQVKRKEGMDISLFFFFFL
jgi:hypothetical protein